MASELAAQVYENVGTGWIPSVHRDCECEFEYPTRWPQFYHSFLMDDPDAIALLDERDRALEHHLAHRCGPPAGPVTYSIIANVDPDNLDQPPGSPAFGPAQYTYLQEVVSHDLVDPDTLFAGGAHMLVFSGEDATRSVSTILLPPGTYSPTSMTCEFGERNYSGDFPPPILASDPGGMDMVTRTLTLQLRDSTVAWSGDPADPSSLIWSRTASVTGPRYSTTVTVPAPLGTYSVPTWMRAWCTFTNIRDEALAAPAHFAGGVFLSATGVRIGGNDTATATPGPAGVNPFDYPTRWPQLHEALLSGDQAQVDDAVAVLDERDRALEYHLTKVLTCFGTDYAKGVTCEFEYPTRWPQLADALLSGDEGRVIEAVGLLQLRDIELETHLKNRVCGNLDIHGNLPDSVTQVYENVT